MKAKRVWGYKLTMIKNGGGKKEFVRYTPMEIEIDGMRFWYIAEPDDEGKCFNITHADSGIKVSTIRNSKVSELPEKMEKMIQSINERIADKEEKLLHESMTKMKDIMEYVAQFDSPNGFIKYKEGYYPPEKIPYEAQFAMDFGKLKMFV